MNKRQRKKQAKHDGTWWYPPGTEVPWVPMPRTDPGYEAWAAGATAAQLAACAAGAIGYGVLAVLLQSGIVTPAALGDCPHA